MFRSEVTQQLSEPGEKQFRTVTAMRQVTYVNKLADGRTIVSKGWEPVHESKHREGETINTDWWDGSHKEIYHVQ